MAWYHAVRKIRRIRVQRQINDDVQVFVRGFHPEEPSNVSIRLDEEQAADVHEALGDYLDGGLDDDMVEAYPEYEEEHND